MSFNPNFRALPGAILRENGTSQTSTTDLDRLQKLKSDIVSGLHPIYCVPDEEEPPPLKKEKASSAVSPAAAAAAAPPTLTPAPLDYERPTNEKRSASASAAPASPADVPTSKKRRKRDRKAAKLAGEHAAPRMAEPSPAPIEAEEPVESLSVPSPATAELIQPVVEPVVSELHLSAQPGLMRVSGSLAFDLAENADESIRDSSAAPSASAALETSGLAATAEPEASHDSHERLSAARMTQSVSAEGASLVDPQEAETGPGLTRDQSEDQPMQDLDGAPIDLDTQQVGQEARNVAGPSDPQKSREGSRDVRDKPVTSTDAQRELENLAGNARKRGGKKNRQKNAARNTGRQQSPGRQRTSTEGSAGGMPSRGMGGPREAFRPPEPLPPLRDPYLDQMAQPPGRFYDERGPAYDPYYDRGPPPAMLPPPTGRWDDQRPMFQPPPPYYERPIPYYGQGYPAPFPDQGYRPDLVFDRRGPPDLYGSGFYPPVPPQQQQPAPYNGPATPMAGSYRDSGRRNR